MIIIALRNNKSINNFYCLFTCLSFVFQAQLIDLRSDLYEVRATKSILEKELHTMLLQLHASQLQVHQKSGQTDLDSDSIKKKLVSH